MTQEQAAEAFSLSKSGYIKVEDGERGLKADRIAKAAQIFNVTPADVLAAPGVPAGIDIDQAQEMTAAISLSGLPVFGEVAAGRWIEIDDHVDEPEYDPVPVLPDARWNARDQYGLVVRGTSINRIALDGDILACVNAVAARYVPREDDLVIAELRRHAGHLRQRTAKRFSRKNSHVELWPDSDDPRWQKPIIIPNGASPLDYQTEDEDGRIDVAIVALVTWVHRPIQRRRRG
ncbi:hypothetical protein ASF39_15555 [Methylobacterium sp. Leaf108]|nr:hypothetical protein ASF39_15555 [Methylobacterium sp. Leaf108]